MIKIQSNVAYLPATKYLLGTHIKYRKAFLGGLNEPYEFNHIK